MHTRLTPPIYSLNWFFAAVSTQSTGFGAGVSTLYG